MTALFWRPPSLSSLGLTNLLPKFFPLDNVEESSVVEFDGYEDRNYKFSAKLREDATTCSRWFVAKFLNSRDSKDVETVDGLVKMTKFLTKSGIKCPYPIPSLTGYEVVRIAHNDLIPYSNDSPKATTDSYYCLLVSKYIEGEVLGYNNHSPILLHEVGILLGTLNKELMAFEHQGLANRNFEKWDMRLLINRKKHLPLVIKNQMKEEILNTVLNYFEMYVIPVMDKLESGFIHNDFNAMNILVTMTNNQASHISGVIDFFNCLFSPHVFDLGIVLSYTMAHRAYRGEDPVSYVKPIIDGYLSVHPLSSQSLDILYYVILGKAAQSLINSAESHQREPSNEYILIDSKPLWYLIKYLLSEGKDKIDDIWGIKAILKNKDSC